MKGYCTAPDVRLALAPLADYDEVGTAARLTDEQINDAIGEAEGVVDSYISRRYTIPIEVIDVPDPDTPGNTLIFNVAPDPVRGITRSVAAFLATLTFRKGKDITEDDPIRLRYGVALGALVAIRDRQANLPAIFPVIDDTSQGVSIVNLYEGNLFGFNDVGMVASGAAGAQVLLPVEGYWP